MSNSYSAIVEQAIELLEDISASAYQKKLPPHFPSSIGAHIRHVIDHFSALINGCTNAHIDYNIRQRYADIEQLPDLALSRLSDIKRWLENIPAGDLAKPLAVTSEIDVSCEHSTTCKSTLERELVFVSSHAIHHYALIKIMCAMQNKSIPEYFGYAPATITHIKSA